MQAISDTVRNPVVAFGFLGAAAVIHLRERWSPRAALVLLAFITYALGGFGLTFGISVPLNEQLAEVSLAAAPDVLAQTRQEYEEPWNTWNMLRTLFSTAAFLMLVAAPFVRTAVERARSNDSVQHRPILAHAD